MQKFFSGNHVRIADNLGPGREHFLAGKEAIVLLCRYFSSGQVEGQYSYCLFIKDHGFAAWYNEEDLTLIGKEGSALLEQWAHELPLVQAKREEERRLKEAAYYNEQMGWVNKFEEEFLKKGEEDE